MAIGDRPYIGSWEIGKQTIVRHTPDARVLINGQTEFAVCATCNKKTDFNQYITSISCDPSTDPITSASISLSVPRHKSDVFSHDGNYVLEAGLEIVIQMRGYYPVKGYAAKGQETNESGLDSEETPVYPYYQVFRGVVTEVSHEFSGGFYTASMSCANILHFWQYLYLSTNGSVFGKKPKGSGVGVDLTGHVFTGMSPYGIIYTLMRVGFGAAFGVNWTIATQTNIAAVDDSTGESLFKHAALWWEKRWQESSMRLRMYGFDGSLFNAFEQSYLGIFDNDGGGRILKTFDSTNPDVKDFDKGGVKRKAGARAVGYQGTESTAAIVGDDGSRLDATKMQAFTLDLGRIGSVNMFEGEYMSKLEIANTAKEITGFEFYQDVDGDIVFKPPFYNLDTREDPVYRISDRDLISISESEREPEATYVKGSGSLFQNFTGILSGEFGTRQGKYVDWRLVAKFGWKETSFESHYYAGSKQMFIGAIMRLDVANMEMRSASITIPLRPELRPGYPVYVEHLDCFYYVKSMSHSFSPGGACQTTLTCASKRAKWLPPGLPDRSEGGSALPTLNNVHLDAPGDYPAMPLYVFPEDIEGNVAGSSGPPRIIGYPNVVLALDPDRINPRTIPGLPTLTQDTLFDVALSIGALRRNPDDPENSYLLSAGDNPSSNAVIQKTALITAYNDVSEAANPTLAAEAIEKLSEANPNLGAVLNAVFQSGLSDIEDAENLSRYMSLQRNLKNVFGAGGDDAPSGEYRYYSSSAPLETDQAPYEFSYDQETNQITKVVPGGPDSAISSKEITVLRQEGDRIKMKSDFPTRGFRVYGLNAPEDAKKSDKSGGFTDVTTRDIRFINFTRSTTRVKINVSSEGSSGLAAFMLDTRATAKVMAAEMEGYALRLGQGEQGQDLNITELFGINDPDGNGYGGVFARIEEYGADLGLTPGPEDVNNAFAKFNPANTGQNTGGFYNAFSAFTRKITGKVSIIDRSDPSIAALLEALFPDESPTDADIIAAFADFDESGDILNIAYVDIPNTTSKPRGKTGNIKNVTGKPLNSGIKALATKLGRSLAGLLGSLQAGYRTYAQEQNARLGSDEFPLPEEYESRSKFLESFTGYQESVKGTFTFTTPSYTNKYKHTAVLPVSDNAGYEVYGTMAYGRGLDIKKYRGLLDTLGSPTTTDSMKAVEAFFADLALNGMSAPEALQVTSPEKRAELAAALNTTDDKLDAVVENITSDDSDAVFIRNTPVTSRSRGMSNTFGLSVAELADLTVDDSTVCLCKGVEASHFLQAFTGDFIELRGDEAVNDFLHVEAETAGFGYETTKQALAGQALDTRFQNELERMGKNTYEAVRSVGRTIESEYQSTRDQLNEAGQGVVDAFQVEAGQATLTPDEEG